MYPHADDCTCKSCDDATYNTPMMGESSMIGHGLDVPFLILNDDHPGMTLDD